MIAKQLKSKVYIIDPTPKSIEHIKYIKGLLDGKNKIINDKSFGGGDKNYIKMILDNKISSNDIIFEPFGLYTENNTLKFYKPANPSFRIRFLKF